MDMKLSISLLVSGKKNTYKKCLNSLKPILWEIPSELIIVFTGTDSAVYEDLHQYTDKVLTFQWCDDFSAARNAGLKEARGEWFMYIDDDEWFEDTGEIITFFKSGEYKQYTSASYIARNYGDYEGKSHTDTPVLRLYKNDGSIRFIGVVHEYILLPDGKHRQFSDYVHHYGYVTGKNRRPKTDRNLPLLLKDVEKEPEMPKHYMQLALEYRAVKDFKKAEEYCRKGLEVSAALPYTYTTEFWMRAHLPAFISQQGENRRALKTAEALAMEEETPDLAKAYLYFTIAGICSSLCEAKTGIAYVKRFHEIKDRLYRKADEVLHSEAGDLNMSEIERRTPSVYVHGLHFAVREEDYGLLREILGWIPWNDEGKISPYYQLVEAWKEDYPFKKENLLKCLSAVADDNDYILLQRALYAGCQNRSSEVLALLDRLNLYQTTDLSAMNYQVIDLAIRHGSDLSRFVEQLPLEIWERDVRQIVNEIEIEQCEEECGKITEALQPYPVQSSLFKLVFLEKQMLQSWQDEDEMYALAVRYCPFVIDYYKSFYQEKYFSPELRHLLPSKCIFALLLSESLQAMAEKQADISVQKLREALHIAPEFSVAISKLLNRSLHQTKVTEENKEEFEMLGRQVKIQIRTFIEEEKYTEAYIILNKLAQMLPDDLELLKMKLFLSEKIL